MISIYLTLEGMQLIQAKHEDLIRTLGPRGEMLAQWVHYATQAAYEYATAITHVITGSLQASHRMSISDRRGLVYIDPSAVNWKYPQQRPAQYGPVEHARGGSHAFYARTVAEKGPAIMQYAQNLIRLHL